MDSKYLTEYTEYSEFTSRFSLTENERLRQQVKIRSLLTSRVVYRGVGKHKSRLIYVRRRKRMREIFSRATTD